MSKINMARFYIMSKSFICFYAISLETMHICVQVIILACNEPKILSYPTAEITL